MIVGAASGWSQTTLNSRSPNPVYRTLFNMAILVLTVQAAGQVYLRLGGRPDADLSQLVMPLAGMALTYFFVNTVPIAIAIALTTQPERLAHLEDRLRLERAQLPARRGRGGGRDQGDGELGLLADAAAVRGAALSDLQDVSRRQGERGAAGRDSRSRARRDHHDGLAAEHPRVQPGGRADVRLRAARHPRPQCRAAAAAGRARAAGRRAERIHDHRRRPAGRTAGRADRPARRRHRVPARADGGAARQRHPRRAHRVRPRHHRTARARGAAAPVAEARGDRPARRRRRARLQQHPDEHHGRGRSAADAAARPTMRRATRRPRSSSRWIAAPA